MEPRNSDGGDQADVDIASARRQYDAFLKLHASAGGVTPEPAVYVYRGSPSAGVTMDATLLEMDIEDVQHAFDTTSVLVQKLLTQLSTYDCTRQKIVALALSRRCVLSDVFWVKREIDAVE